MPATADKCRNGGSFMFIADYHSHTQFSNDSRTNMRELAQCAYENGISQLCFTDHIDDCCAEDVDPRIRGTSDEFPEMLKEFAALKEEMHGKIDLRIGMELSGYNHMPELALKIASYPGFDFVMASLHNTRDTLDFFYYQFQPMEECEKIALDYMLENLEIAKMGGFDCMAHIGYFNKCMARMGFVVDTMKFRDIYEDIFKILVDKGLGLEINTSGLMNPMGESIPNLEALKLYRSLGGEIITVGSDTHGTRFYPRGIKEGYDILAAAGFDYVTTFKNRKPEFVKIV